KGWVGGSGQGGCRQELAVSQRELRGDVVAGADDLVEKLHRQDTFRIGHLGSNDDRLVGLGLLGGVVYLPDRGGSQRGIDRVDGSRRRIGGAPGSSQVIVKGGV